MRVRCVSNTIESVANWRDLQDCMAALFRYPDGKLNLTIGNHYTIHGLLFTSLCSWALICEDPADGYPIWYPMPLFEIAVERRQADEVEMSRRQGRLRGSGRKLRVSQHALGGHVEENAAHVRVLAGAVPVGLGIGNEATGRRSGEFDHRIRSPWGALHVRSKRYVPRAP